MGARQGCPRRSAGLLRFHGDGADGRSCGARGVRRVGRLDEARTTAALLAKATGFPATRRGDASRAGRRACLQRRTVASHIRPRRTLRSGYRGWERGQRTALAAPQAAVDRTVQGRHVGQPVDRREAARELPSAAHAARSAPPPALCDAGGRNAVDGPRRLSDRDRPAAPIPRAPAVLARRSPYRMDAAVELPEVEILEWFRGHYVEHRSHVLVLRVPKYGALRVNIDRVWAEEARWSSTCWRLAQRRRLRSWPRGGRHRSTSERPIPVDRERPALSRPCRLDPFFHKRSGSPCRFGSSEGGANKALAQSNSAFVGHWRRRDSGAARGPGLRSRKAHGRVTERCVRAPLPPILPCLPGAHPCIRFNHRRRLILAALIAAATIGSAAPCPGWR